MSEKKFLGGKNNNAYIVFYSAVMVIIVAIALAFTNQALKERQNENRLNEKKDAIVASLRLDKGTYDERINAYIVNEKGEKVVFEDKTDEQLQSYIFEQLGSLAEAYKNKILIVFEDKETGEVVIPVTGKGLWGDIWGYVALKSDMNTIKGVIFDHKGETPGLGAEIATPNFQTQFTATTKQIYNEAGKFVSIDVKKGGGTKDNLHAVDAVTGGTKTSDGLRNMLSDCLKQYDAFFKARQGKAVVAECPETEECAGQCPEVRCPETEECAGQCPEVKCDKCTEVENK